MTDESCFVVQYSMYHLNHPTLLGGCAYGQSLARVVESPYDNLTVGESAEVLGTSFQWSGEQGQTSCLFNHIDCHNQYSARSGRHTGHDKAAQVSLVGYHTVGENKGTQSWTRGSLGREDDFGKVCWNGD